VEDAGEPLRGSPLFHEEGGVVGQRKGDWVGGLSRLTLGEHSWEWTREMPTRPKAARGTGSAGKDLARDFSMKENPKG